MTHEAPSAIREVRGEMPFFGNGSANRAMNRLVLGPWRFAGTLAIGAATGGAAVLGELVVNGGGAGASDGGLVAAFVIYAALVFAAFQVAGRMVRAVSRRRWMARGAPSRMNILWRLDDEGFRTQNETKIVVIPWPYVSQLSLEGRHWLLVGAGVGYILSRKVFTSPDEERAFIAALLERLAPAAKARSRKAQSWLVKP